MILRVFSFSYRDGIPKDPGEHGGGFVFDVRCLPNPGRDPHFRDMTGLDSEVVAWLEAEAEVLLYRSHVQALVEQAVEKYLQRGFDSLSVGFGCTGGQHRSVYFADYVSKHIEQRYPVRVVTDHIEQSKTGRIPSRSS